MDYQKNHLSPEKDIIFTETVKAGKRIYYLDVKRSIRGDLFLSVTESKKVPVKGAEEEQFNFEKHKIFLYQEDFTKFVEALSNAMRYIHEHSEGSAHGFQRAPSVPDLDEEKAAGEELPTAADEAVAVCPAEADAADDGSADFDAAETDGITPISLNIDF